MKKNHIIYNFLMLILVLLISIIITYYIDKILFQYIPTADFSLFISLYIFIFSLIAILLKPIYKLTEYIITSKHQDFQKPEKFNYYRDILKNYSMLLLAKCYGKFDYKDMFVAALLQLKLTNKINIKNDEILILDKDNLFPSELSLIRALQNSTMYTKKTLKWDMYTDFLNDNKIRNLFSNKIYNFTFLLKCTLYLLLIVNIFALMYSFGQNITTVVLINSFSCIFCFITALTIGGTHGKLVLNAKGKEIQSKLMGLNHFLKDFSIIEERKINELINWEYYMIYAILFNYKGNLDKSAYEYYKKYIDRIIQ